MRPPSTAVTAAATAACRVWAARGSISASATASASANANASASAYTNILPCSFGTSVYDTLFSGLDARKTKTKTKTKTKNQGQYEESPGHCDRMLVDLIEEETTREQPHRVILHAGGSCSDGEKGTNDLFRADSTIYRGIPFGRARDCPTLSPRALSDTARDRRRSPHVRLAVVGMVMVGGDYGEDPNSKSSDYVTTSTTTTTAASSSETDDDRNDDENDDPLLVLITRRPSYMRSFPGAFVFPGGNLDEGESLADAVARELSEETGLAIDPDSWTLECLWESVYPTALPDLDGNEEEEDQEGAIRAHHLVCYFSGRLQRKPPLSTLSSSAASLRLCPEEVDGAVWLSKSDVSSLLGWGGTPTDDNVDAVSSADDREVALHVGAAATTMDTNTNTTTTTTTKIPLSDLAGIYPRARGSGDGDGDDPNEGYAWCGMAQGSLFALEEFVAKRANTIFATENE